MIARPSSNFHFHMSDTKLPSQAVPAQDAYSIVPYVNMCRYRAQRFINWETLVFVRSLKSSNVELSHYLAGRLFKVLYTTTAVSTRAHTRWPSNQSLQSQARRMTHESFSSSCLSTRDQIGRSTRNSNPVMTSSVGGAKGCSDHSFHAPPAYTA